MWLELKNGELARVEEMIYRETFRPGSYHELGLEVQRGAHPAAALPRTFSSGS